MLTAAWLLGVVCCGLTAGWPVQVSTWPEKNVPVKVNNGGDESPSFYHLPVYQHAERPLVPREMLKPVPLLLGPDVFQSNMVPELFLPQLKMSPASHRARPMRGSLPPELHALLFPKNVPHQSLVPERRHRAVEVWCGTDLVTVRVDRSQVSAWNAPPMLRVGSCRPGQVNTRFLFFRFRPSECGGRFQVVGGQLVYTHILSSTPPPSSQNSIIRVMPLYLPIQCQYNRFHYSYQVGYSPYVQQNTFLQSMRSKLRFSLFVSNARGEALAPGHWTPLGEPVFFVAEAETLLPGERLYVDSCFITSSKDPEVGPKVDIITNYGCMTDSRREGSRSWIWSGGGSVVKFSMDAFLFSLDSHVLFLHCSMSVDVATSQKSKYCNYNMANGRWEELQTPASVCACCDAKCTDLDKPATNIVSSPGWSVQQKGIQNKEMLGQAGEWRDFKGKGKIRSRFDSHRDVPEIYEQTKKADFKEHRIGTTPSPSTSAGVLVHGTVELFEATQDTENSPTVNSNLNNYLQLRPRASVGFEGLSESGNVSSDIVGFGSGNGSTSSSFARNGSAAVPRIKMCSDGEGMDCDHVSKTKKYKNGLDSLFSQSVKFDPFDNSIVTVTPWTPAGRTSTYQTNMNKPLENQEEAGKGLKSEIEEYILDEGGSGEPDGVLEQSEEDNMIPGLETETLESDWPRFRVLKCKAGPNCGKRSAETNEVDKLQAKPPVSSATKIMQESPNHSAAVILTTLPDSGFKGNSWARFWGLENHPNDS